MPKKPKTKGNSVCLALMKRKFKQIDIYGQSVNLTYKGEESFKTFIGAFATFIVVTVLIAYGSYRAYICFSKQEPSVSSY